MFLKLLENLQVYSVIEIYIPISGLAGPTTAHLARPADLPGYPHPALPAVQQVRETQLAS